MTLLEQALKLKDNAEREAFLLSLSEDEMQQFSEEFYACLSSLTSAWESFAERVDGFLDTLVLYLKTEDSNK